MARKTNKMLAKEFTRKVRKVVAEIPKEKVKFFMRAMTFEALRRLVEKTPVDTGRARGGWMVSISIPSRWKPPKDDPRFFDKPAAPRNGGGGPTAAARPRWQSTPETAAANSPETATASRTGRRRRGRAVTPRWPGLAIGPERAVMMACMLVRYQGRPAPPRAGRAA